MKRIICILLALLMVFSMTACQSKEETPASASTENTAAAETPITEATEPATEATEPIDEGYIFDVEASLAENSQTVTYKTPKEYETALHEMGFVEYRGDLVRPTLTSGVACNPISLTYNDEAFRMDFSSLDLVNIEDWDNPTAELKTVEGWSLYGLKNTTSFGNLSAYKISNYENADFSDYAELSPDIASEFVQRADWWLYNLENGTHTCMITIWEYYYPSTGNLYNIVRDHGDPSLLANVPQILCRTEEDLEYATGNGFVDQVDLGFDVSEGEELRYAILYYVEKDGPQTSLTMDIYYKPGMTLLEWSQSDYAFAVNNPFTKVSANGEYLQWDHGHGEIEGFCCLMNINTPIEDIVISEEGQTDYLIAPNMLTMSNTTVMEFGSMAEAEAYMATMPNEGN